MKLPLTRIQFYRLLITFMVISLSVVSWTTFYNFFSLPTDENLFRNVNARLAAVKSFSGELIAKKALQGARPNGVSSALDSVLAGDLLLSINGGEINTIKDAYSAIYNSPANDVRMEVLRPQLNYQLTFKVQRSKIQQEFFSELPNYVLVIEVTQGGASDRAGLKVGDLIIRINNQEFKSALDADKIMRLGQIGKSLKYEVLRLNKYVELNVVLAKFGIPVSILIFHLSGIIFMAIGFFIAVSRPNIFAALLIGFGFLLTGYFMTLAPVRRDFGDSTFIAIRQILFWGSLAIGSAMLFHARHYFPVESVELAGKKWIARGYYIFSVTAVAVALYASTPAPLFLLPVYGLLILFKFRKSASEEYKRLNVLIRWSYRVSAAIICILLIFFNDQLGIVGFGIYGVFLLAVPFSYLYTIGRYRLLDLQLRVRRNTQYSVVTALWTVAVFYLLVWVFFQLPQLKFPDTNIVFTGASIEVNEQDTPALTSQRVSAERVLLMLLAIAVTFVFMKIRIAGQRFIDKKYFRTQYDYRKAQQELGELLATTLSMEELGKGFVQKLSELMRLKTAGVVFFRDEKHCSCEAAYGFNGEEWRKFCISHEVELIDAIKQFQNEIRIQYLPAHIKEEFQQEGFQYLIPIRSKEKLIGTILVGEKLAETTFRQEDLTFLTAAAKQASVAIENAFLYEELAEKERMKHELDIARRIQLDSLPQTTPNVKGLDIAGTSYPAMEVGGDFYDYLLGNNSHLTVIIGDVSGKGTSAALYMAKVQGILRSLHGFNLSPRELFTRANKLLCRDLEKRSFVTVLGAEFNVEKRTMVVARAGHLPLWHYKAKKVAIETVIPKGLGLGLDDAGVFTAEMEEKEITYETGDIFLFATDGVTDSRSADGEFGEERLRRVLIEQKNLSALNLQKNIIDEISTFVGSAPQHDDQTVVVVKVV